MARRVEGTGPKDARIYIVGESPGREEERLGVPFVGPAGRELDSELAAAGIERRSVYIDNCLQYRPVGDKDAAFFAAKNKPTPQFLEGIVNIAKLIQEHKPELVIAVGEYALWALTAKKGITKWAGSILECIYGDPPPKVIPILHPAYILRGQYQYRQANIWWLRKARSGDLSLPQYDFTIAMTPAKVAEVREEILSAKRLVFDIEVSGRSLLCIGFGLSPTRAICVPNFGPAALELYEEILTSDIPKGNQNVTFDWSFLEAFYGIRPKNVVFDTMVESHILYPTLPHDLAFLTSVYTNQPYYKDEGKVWRGKTTEVLYEYNCKDCAVTYQIDQCLQREIDENGLRDCANFVLSLIEPYTEATVKGWRVNTARLNDLAREAEQQAKALQAVLNVKLGREINVNSPQQVKEVVYGDLRLPKRYKHGKLTTQQDTLLDLAAKTGSAELTIIVKIRRLKKLLSNWYNDRILDHDGRFRCSHNLAGTKTGRLSTTQTLWGSGSNAQNWPDDARKILIPDEGFTLLSLDLQQAESVVVAFDSEDPLEIEWFEQGLDSHKMLAALIFGKDPEDITPEERYLAKRCHHALNYQMGHLKFAMVVNADYEETGVALTVEQAKSIRNKFHAIRPNLQAWWSEITKAIRYPPHTLTNLAPSKRRRVCIEQWSDETIRDFISWKPQSTVVDVCHEGVRRVHYELADLRRDGSLFLLSQLHDGVTYEIRSELLDDWIEEIAEKFLVPLETKGRKFVIPVEVKVSKKSWGDLEKVLVLKNA